jgi:hypothetical protein
VNSENGKGTNDFMIIINRSEQIILYSVTSLIKIINRTITSVSTDGRDGIASQIVTLLLCLDRLNVSVQ